MTDSPYILVTAARNEAGYIRATIKSVIAQTQQPSRWIIVSDGSVDGTDLIVREFAKDHPFIELLHVDADSERNFGSKAMAINAGYDQIRAIKHDWVGILDADITMEPDYYEQVIERFKQEPKLGIAGGVLFDLINGRPVRQMTNPNWSVSGPIQTFRRECYQDIGGYLPLRGGIDAAAEIMARMEGWTVRAFPELTALHHRQTGREKHSQIGLFFHRGLEDYQLGYHPLFFTARSILRFREKPFVIGGMAMLLGYIWAGLSRAKKKVPKHFVDFLRKEQLGRIRAHLIRKGVSPA